MKTYVCCLLCAIVVVLAPTRAKCKILWVYVDTSGSLRQDLLLKAISTLADVLPEQVESLRATEIVVVPFSDPFSLYDPQPRHFRIPSVAIKDIQEQLRRQGEPIGSWGAKALEKELERQHAERTKVITQAADCIRSLRGGKAQCTSITELLLRFAYYDAGDGYILCLTDLLNECAPFGKDIADVIGERQGKTVPVAIVYVPASVDGSNSALVDNFVLRKREIESLFTSAAVVPTYMLSTNWSQLFSSVGQNR